MTDDLLDALAERLAEKIAGRVVELLRAQDAATPSQPWLDSAAAAEYLGIHRDTLRKLAAAGAIPNEQDGPTCKRYFSKDALNTWRASGGRFHAASTPAKAAGHTGDSR
jgi:excisionase family DNA binding protein